MISEREAAKFPFLKGAVGLVERLDLKVNDLVDPAYGKILDRGEERVSEAILKGVVQSRLDDTLMEMLSFPVAIMFVTALDDQFLKRRYALAEAIRTYELLKEESETRIAKLVREEFGWNLHLVVRELDGQVYKFELHFSDYLNNASSFHEEKWKLVNRMMQDGYVMLTRMEAVRLIQVEVEELIRRRVSKHGKIVLPEPIRDRISRIRKLFEENKMHFSPEELPSEIIINAFPPCIKQAFEGLMSGSRASHLERFALTSFLINAGMDLDSIVKLFISVTDFNEQYTRYQIEHIAGLRGGRTRYTPPVCATMRTHGICYNPDAICKTVKHPLNYYRIKVRDHLER